MTIKEYANVIRQYIAEGLIEAAIKLHRKAIKSNDYESNSHKILATRMFNEGIQTWGAGIMVDGVGYTPKSF